MTWDLDGSEEAIVMSQQLAVKSKQPEYIARSISYSIAIIRDIEQSESLTKSGWAKLKNIKDTLNRVITQ